MWIATLGSIGEFVAMTANLARTTGPAAVVSVTPASVSSSSVTGLNAQICPPRLPIFLRSAFRYFTG